MDKNVEKTTKFLVGRLFSEIEALKEDIRLQEGYLKVVIDQDSETRKLRAFLTLLEAKKAYDKLNKKLSVLCKEFGESDIRKGK